MANVVAFRMTDSFLRKRIAQIAVDSGKVTITAHAVKRMKQRRVTRTQVQDVLLSGKVVESDHQNARGDWRCTLQKLTAGDLVTIPACLYIDENGEAVIVITVIT